MDPRRRSPHLDRRQCLLATTAAVTGLAAWPLPASGRVLGPPAAEGPPAPTPRLTDGPFYPPAFAPEPTPSLLVGTAKPPARSLQLVGRIVDRSGRPLEGSRVEIWQCDANRRYHHPADGPAEGRDPAFLGHGWQTTRTGGQYAFETIRPVAYPGRTPHIHVKVKVDGRPVLSSQIFMPDETQANAQDFLWRSLANRQPLALATLERGSGLTETARFDIVIG